MHLAQYSSPCSNSYQLRMLQAPRALDDWLHWRCVAPRRCGDFVHPSLLPMHNGHCPLFLPRTSQALAALDDRMHYLDCGAAFINAGGAGVNASMLPGDALHPNAAGYRTLATCLDPTLRQVFAARDAAAPSEPRRALSDVDDTYAHTCDHVDTTSAEACAFAARMAAAAAPAAQAATAG